MRYCYESELHNEAHSLTGTPLNFHLSTHGVPEPPSPPRCSGESMAGADCFQSESGNSRVLDTLDLKLQVATNYKSTNLLRAVEQLESRARHSPHILPIVQLEADPGPTATSTSLPGACCTPPHSPAIPSHSPPRRSQMAAPDGQVVENELSPPRRPAALETFKFRRNWNTC